MIPTPRTDAALSGNKDGVPGALGKLIDHAEQLERELTEAKQAIEELEIRHAAAMLHTQTIVDEANAIRNAAIALKTAKGRYHSEQAAKHLFALLP